GIARTPGAVAVVMVTSADIPGRRPAGTSTGLMATLNETTPLLPPVLAVGAIEVTVPTIVAPFSAATVTVAAWPRLIEAIPLSTTLVLAWSGLAAIWMASPGGASAPATIVTAVTIPSEG